MITDNLIEKINSLADLFKIYQPTEDQKMLLDYTGNDAKVSAARKALIADIISEVFNEGKLPEHGWGYLPYFDSQRGFAFLSSRYDRWDSDANVGSRLCHYVGSEAESDHLGQQFFGLHKAHYLGK